MFAARILVGGVILSALALAACSQKPRPIGAPEGTYTPARLEVVGGGASGPVDGAIVQLGFFPPTVRPLVGRFFAPQEFTSGPSAVVVLSRQYWDIRFQSRPDIIGTAIEVDGRKRVIVGVAPPEFQPERAGLLWIPKSD